MAQSSIEWTEMTWNPTTGCDKLSSGCKFCYAEVMSRRLKAMGVEKYKEGFKLECQAMKIVRDEMGLTNVKLMIPFCRTP